MNNAKCLSQVAQDKITKSNPTVIGYVGGVAFYEDPYLGDEEPLLIKKDSLWMRTDEFELPALCDIPQILKQARIAD